MFTPLRSLTPWREMGRKNGSVSGPGSALNATAASPRNGEALARGKTGGPLQEAGVMDQGTLSDRVSKLDNELFEYQYNMGLLLIEKKEWNLKYEELMQALTDASDTLKSERMAHSSALSEMEKREENLKKALGVERQCVLDLEKALHEMRSEQAEIKFNADSKLTEANALVTSVEEKSLEVEAKLHAADAKFAEVSRKSSEIERKLHELEAQENSLRRERSRFSTERETHDASISRYTEDLREWERKLKEAEERLADGRRLLNERERKANVNDNLLKEKQMELEELRRKIENDDSSLKNKEEDISRRLASLALKEQEAFDARKRLEERERRLLELEEKLSTREKLEIQKQLDEHQRILTENQKVFELEMEQKRKLNDEQLKDKVAEVEKKEVEILHEEEKVKKREQTVEKKMDKLREKEIDIDSKSKALKEREKSLIVEEKNLEKGKMLVVEEKQDLLRLKAELENLKDAGEKQLLKLNEEKEQLKVTEDERVEFARLQLELKEEINKYRFQSEQLMKEVNDLKQEKERFEKEWEELDNKRAQVKEEEVDIAGKKIRLEKLRLSEEERLNNEKLEKQQYLQREQEALKLAQDSFAARMEHENSILAEKVKSDRIKLIHDLDVRKHELEAEFQRKQEELEISFQGKQEVFEQEKEKDLGNISYLRDRAEREMEEMKLERLRMQKEQIEISENKKRIETQQLGMKKDIEELVNLSQKLKDQREQFVRERERFVSFAEKQKNCNICGETIREFMLSDLHPLVEPGNLEPPPPLSKVVQNYLEAERFNAETEPTPTLVKSGSPAAGRTLSWLRKCTSKILIFSPGKKLDLDDTQDPRVGTSVKQDVTKSPKTSPGGEKEPEVCLRVAINSSDVQVVESEATIREFGVAQTLHDQDPSSSPENSNNTDVKASQPYKGGRGRRRITRTAGRSKTNGNVDTSFHTNDDRENSDIGGAPKNTRKRNRPRGSQAAVSGDQTDEHSDSIKEGDRPKMRQRVVTAEHGQSRYNLRTNKKSLGTVVNGSFPKARKGKEEEGGPSQSENLVAVGTSREEIDEHGSGGVGAEDGDNDPERNTATASEFSDSQFKNAGGVDTTNIVDEDVGPNDEVNGTAAEGAMEYSGEVCKTESHEESEDDINGDDDEVDHPGETSIGKKLWTFLTT